MAMFKTMSWYTGDMIKRTALKVTVLAVAALAHRCAPAPEATTAPPSGPSAAITVVDCTHVSTSGVGFEPGSPIELQFGDQPPLAYKADERGSFAIDVPRTSRTVAVAAVSQVSTGFYAYVDVAACSDE